MGCATCGKGKTKVVYPQKVNYVLKNVSTGKTIGEYGSKVEAVVNGNRLPYPAKVHPVKISSTEEKPKATKTVKKVAKKPKKES